VTYLATKTDKTAITRIRRIDWDTVGRACERVGADGLDPCRLDGLFDLAWTDESLAEVERVLLERKGLSVANAAVRSLSSPRVGSEIFQKSHSRPSKSRIRARVS
jgi:hypothetical protein